MTLKAWRYASGRTATLSDSWSYARKAMSGATEGRTLDTDDKRKVIRCSVAMLDQLLSYCDWAAEGGSYYGNEKQFRSRHKKIRTWLNAIRHNKLRKVHP